MKTYQETKPKTPAELLYIEVIKKAFSDVFNLGNASEQHQKLLQSQAKTWFNEHNKDFRLICEYAGTEPEYIIRIYDNLMYNYNYGKITKEKLKFGISRLELKI